MRKSLRCFVLKEQDNLAPLEQSILDFSSFASIAEIFTKKQLDVKKFPNSLETGFRSVRMTDDKGSIIYTSEDLSEINKKISATIMQWSNNTKNDIQFFFLDRDTIIGVTHYPKRWEQFLTFLIGIG